MHKIIIKIANIKPFIQLKIDVEISINYMNYEKK